MIKLNKTMELDPAIPIIQSVSCVYCAKLTDKSQPFVFFSGNVKKMNTDRYNKNDPGVSIQCFDTPGMVFCDLECLTSFIEKQYNQKQ